MQKLFPLILIILCPAQLWCGNPAVTTAGAFRFWDEENNIVRYDIQELTVRQKSELDIHEIIKQAFDTWSQITYSELQFELGTIFPLEGNIDEIAEFIHNADDGINPIIFDLDGKLFDTLYGIGSAEHILGLTSLLGPEGSGRIHTASIILNSSLLQKSGNFRDRLYSTLLHEVGHFSGLGHTQIHTDFAFDDDPSNNEFIPAMFPVESVDFISPSNLLPDDEMTLSSLYQTDSFFSDLGSIVGSVVRDDGTPVLGANVVAVKVDDPLISRFAVVSDLNLTNTGDFEFDGLPPGFYEIFIEPINPLFTGFSSVGPYSDTENSPSFIDPVPVEYYNGENESGDSQLDDPEDRVEIEVRAGETAPMVIFITNDGATPVNQWELFNH